MIKKLLLTITVLAATAFQLNAQCRDQVYHPPGIPPGPEGSYQNPIRVHANLGDPVSLGNSRNSPFTAWYTISGFWDNPQTVNSNHPYPFLTEGGLWRHGQTVEFNTEPDDYEGGIIFMCADPSRGWWTTYYRIFYGPGPSSLPPPCGGTN